MDKLKTSSRIVTIGLRFEFIVHVRQKRENANKHNDYF